MDQVNEATEQLMRHLSGFVSSNIKVRDDGTRVVNSAQRAAAVLTQSAAP